MKNRLLLSLESAVEIQELDDILFQIHNQSDSSNQDLYDHALRIVLNKMSDSLLHYNTLLKHVKDLIVEGDPEETLRILLDFVNRAKGCT